MPTPAESIVVYPTERAVISALLYFEIFSYPLTIEEVSAYANHPGATLAELTECLDGLCKQAYVFQFGSFYQTQNRPEWVQQRLACNQRATDIMPIARRMSRFIGSFPFIRGVFVSGSLSKHCMRPDSDIDFFLVTQPGRLWLARTLLVLFKKLVLFNSHKYFCVNYFVDTDHLEIEEKNLFTATETITLLPLYGREWYAAFMSANAWVQPFFPNYPLRDSEQVSRQTRGIVKKSLEWLLGGRLGDWLDERSMRTTVGFWRRKFSHFDPGTFDVALKSRRYVSKHHPLYFQQKVLGLHAQKMANWNAFAEKTPQID